MNTKALQKVFDSLLAIHALTKRFNVVPQTIHNWRLREEDPLPALVLPGHKRPALRFVESDVKAWAARNEEFLGKGKSTGRPPMEKSPLVRHRRVRPSLGTARVRQRRPSMEEWEGLNG